MIKMLSILILVFISYFPAITGGFIWDDDFYVSNNPLLQSIDGLWLIWTTSESPQYYPLVFTSFWIEYHLWGLNPVGYHIVNIFLHAINSVMVWLLLQQLGVRSAWLIGAIFALHPVHVESVAWITERKNVLSGLFYLLAAHSYIRFDENEKRHCYFAAIAFFLMALLSKTVTSSLPVCLLIIRWFRGFSIRLRDIYRLVPFILLGLGMGMLTIWYEVRHVGAEGAEWHLSILQRFLLAGNAVWFYAFKLIWPMNLTFIYPRWKMDVFDLFQWIRFLGVSAAGFVFWYFQKQLGRGPVVGLTFFVITLFPALGFINVYPMRYSFVADHFQYLASIGIIAICVGGFASAIERWDKLFLIETPRVKGFILGGLGFLILVVLSFLTWRQGYVYHDKETLWRDTLVKNPGAWMAHNNMGIELEKQGKLNEAIKHYKEALRLNSRYPIAYNNLGLVLKQKGDFEEAAIYFREAIRNNPKFWESLNNLGYVLYSLGRLEEAASYFQQTLAINPFSVEAHNNLANILDAKGKIEEAKKHYKKALSVDPENAKIHNNLGTLFHEEKEYLKAINHFQKALQLKPDLKETRQNLSMAMEQYRKAEAKKNN
tara:strand:+ start:9264 stop:11063 length:1800 start_codon:yes stop_codon:yes gene_type:complete